MEICERKNCTGCHACYNICPKHCIVMEEDQEGFVYPKIVAEDCIQCGRCKTVCPANDEPSFKPAQQTYAAWSKDTQEHATSTSGGIASAFSRMVIEQGGVVFGAAYNQDLSVQHIMATDNEGVDRLKGSKYIQSTIGNTYRQVKKELSAGKEVLFIGTPCQIGGLRNYIGDKNEKLTMIDLVCHGTPSSKILNQYLSALEKKHHFKTDEISFRNDKGFYFTCIENGDVRYAKKSIRDPFYIGFLRGLYYRPSCNQCMYAQPQRCADITIGDFWGLGQEEPFPYSMKNGISLCMVNTEQGEAFVKRTEDTVYMVKRKTQEAVAGNKQLRFPSPKHKRRETFFRLMNTKGINSALSRVLRKEKLGYLAMDTINQLKTVTKK